MNIDEIKELIREVSDSKLVQFDLSEGNIELSLKKEGAIIRETVKTDKVDRADVENETKQVTLSADESNESDSAVETEASQDKAEEKKTDGYVVKSPLVGTAHLINDETGEPFVTVGTKVKKGQTLAVVEAMKMMNDIDAEVDGTIERILVEDGSTVEYNGEMFVICQND